MIADVRNWFQLLSSRERIFIWILIALIVATVGYYGILRPLSNAIEESKQQYIVAIEREVRIKSKVALLSQPNEALKRPVTGALDDFLSQSAGEAGFAVGSIDAQNDGSVNMSVQSAKSTALFGWLARIERRGISPTTVAITPATNGTVSANLRLKHARN